jgi:hypothetical protein
MFSPEMLCMLVPVGGLFLLFSAIVAVQAHQRGYNFVVWLLAGVLANPVFFLVLLAIMPDYARKALRRQLAAELEEKLVAQRLVPPAAAQPSTLVPQCSLGDQPTVLPPQRSLGDEETRL